VLAYFVYYTNISVQWAIALYSFFSKKGDRLFEMDRDDRFLGIEKAIAKSARNAIALGKFN
jgi:hypothetical protein